MVVESQETDISVKLQPESQMDELFIEYTSDHFHASVMVYIPHTTQHILEGLDSSRFSFVSSALPISKRIAEYIHLPGQ